jgi:hypothetical protein
MPKLGLRRVNDLFELRLQLLQQLVVVLLSPRLPKRQHVLPRDKLVEYCLQPTT